MLFVEIRCEDGWTLFKHSKKCYRFYNNPTTWIQADTECKELQQSSSNLASIQDSQTDDFLTMTMTGRKRPETWVGGRLVNGAWTWTDGSLWAVLDPHPWAPGQPDNEDGDEDSLGLNWGATNQWNDFRGAVTVLPRICQYDPRNT